MGCVIQRADTYDLIFSSGWNVIAGCSLWNGGESLCLFTQVGAYQRVSQIFSCNGLEMDIQHFIVVNGSFDGIVPCSNLICLTIFRARAKTKYAMWFASFRRDEVGRKLKGNCQVEFYSNH